MRYILIDGYIDEIVFGASSIECKGKVSTEYTGTIPTGYTSLQAWAVGEEGKLNAWKIVDGNLVFDNAKYNDLQAKYEKQEKDNSYVRHKEIDAINVSNSKDVKDLYESKKSSADEIITFSNGSDFSMDKINIKPLENITDKIDLVVTGANMLPNSLTTIEAGGITFTQNEDRSISISGTTSSEVEADLAGSITNTDYILTFKKGITYKLSGLTNNILLKFYYYDGTDRELVATSENGDILFDVDKHITQITVCATSLVKRNIQVGDNLAGKTLYFDFPTGFYEMLSEPSNIITTDSNKRIGEYLNVVGSSYSEKTVSIHNGDNFYYYKHDYVTQEDTETSLKEYTLSDDFGTVTSINEDTVSYPYIKAYFNSEGSITINTTIYPMLNVGDTVKEYEPYEGTNYKINLGSNSISGTGLYPNMVYPSSSIYPGAYHYITIQDGKVTLFQGNTIKALTKITMPSTKYGNNTIYTHQSTKLLVEYKVSGSLNNKVIHLEGYTTINNGFSVDLEGNMTCNNAAITGGKIDGAYLNLSDNGGNKNASIEIRNKNSTNNGRCILGSDLFELDGNGHIIYIATNGAYFDSGDNDFVNFDDKFRIYSNGNAYLSGSLTQGSLEELKKNFEKFNGGLELIKNADVYKYNYKAEEDNYKKHIGLVIGDNYKTPPEILNNENTGVDTYSMVSVCFNAIKELNSKIEQLENKIKELESDK